MFQTKVVDKIENYISCPNTFYFVNRAVCEIMWKNAVERGRPLMTIWRMHIACLVPKATETHSEYECTYCFSTATIVARMRVYVALYVHCPSF